MENGGFHLNSPAKNTDARTQEPDVVAWFGLADYLYSIHARGPESKQRATVTLRRSRDPLYRPRPIAIRCRRQCIIDLQADIGHVVAQVYPIKHVALENHTRLNQQRLVIT